VIALRGQRRGGAWWDPLQTTQPPELQVAYDEDLAKWVRDGLSNDEPIQPNILRSCMRQS
jgi:hypothetical protein